MSANTKSNEIKADSIDTNQLCITGESKGTERLQNTEEQIREEISPVNGEAITNGGISVAIIMAMAFLIKCLTELVKAANG